MPATAVYSVSDLGTAGDDALRWAGVHFSCLITDELRADADKFVEAIHPGRHKPVETRTVPPHVRCPVNARGASENISKAAQWLALAQVRGAEHHSRDRSC